MPQLQFWFEFASNYSYLSAMRIDRLAENADVEIIWRPFLLGPIFRSVGWNTSPFNVYPEKGRHMRRDMERIAIDRDVPFLMPKVFPANSLLVTRIAILGEKAGWTPAFSHAIFTAEFGQGQDIAEDEIVRSVLEGMELDADAIITQAISQDIKDGLRARGQEAEKKGIFGAPSFITESGELFWGDDRLEQALSWCGRPLAL